MRLLFTYSICILIYSFSFSQKVESKAFDLTLNSILDHSVDEISVTEAKASPAIYLDAREINEFNVSHIKNAIWVGYDDFQLNRVSESLKNKRIIIYCSIGYRSEKIAVKLKKQGYKNVFNLYGGIFEWVNQDQPVYNSKGKTNRTHAYNKTWGIWLTKGEKSY